MTRQEWEQINSAAQLLGLEGQATLAEIKKAFRRLSKKHHPDIKKASKKAAEKIDMQKLNEAYQLLLDYCASYAFPLVPGKDEPLDGEDWWFERFGQDHHWGKGDAPKSKRRK